MTSKTYIPKLPVKQQTIVLFGWIASIFICFSARAQNKDPDVNEFDCFGDVSYFWKLDSLGLNGYRLEVYKKLEGCKNRDITKERLLKVLGKPNRITADNLGSSYYQYYFLNGRRIPSVAHYTKSVMFIYFRFDAHKPFVVYIGDDHYD